MLILSQQKNTARFILPVSCVHTSKQFWFTLVDAEMKLRQYGKKLIHDHCNIHQQHEKYMFSRYSTTLISSLKLKLTYLDSFMGHTNQFLDFCYIVTFFLYFNLQRDLCSFLCSHFKHVKHLELPGVESVLYKKNCLASFVSVLIKDGRQKKLCNHILNIYIALPKIYKLFTNFYSRKTSFPF